MLVGIAQPLCSGGISILKRSLPPTSQSGPALHRRCLLLLPSARNRFNFPLDVKCPSCRASCCFLLPQPAQKAEIQFSAAAWALCAISGLPPSRLPSAPLTPKGLESALLFSSQRPADGNQDSESVTEATGGQSSGQAGARMSEKRRRTFRGC